MLLSAVSVLVVAQSSSEIPEGLMNNPVYKSKLKLLLNGVACIRLKTILPVTGRVLNSGELLTGIRVFLPSCARLSSKLCITR